MYNCEAIHELCPFVDIAKYSFTTVLGFLFVFVMVRKTSLKFSEETEDGMEFCVFI